MARSIQARFALVLLIYIVFLFVRGLAEAAAATKQPTQSPSTPGPSAAPVTPRPSRAPSTSRPSVAPSRAPSSGPTRSPTKLAVVVPLTVVKDAVVLSEATQASFVVTNLLASPVNVSYVPCDVGSAAWISSPNVTGFILGPSQTVTFWLTLLVSTPNGTDPLQPSTPLNGCIRLKVITITDVDPQFHLIQVRSSLALVCQAGSSSTTGVNHPEPCAKCPLGTYSTSSRALSCTDCAANLPRTVATGSTSPVQCLGCAPGSYCPVGAPPQLCPAGAWEPSNATTSDRSAATCVRFPCLEKFYCGPGAAEGSTYVQLVEYGDMFDMLILIKQEKTFPLEIRNLGSDTVFVTLPTSRPSWVIRGPLVSIPPHSVGVFSITFSSVDIVGESLQSSFALEWYVASHPSARFLASVQAEIQVITLIVTPASFDYAFTVGGSNETALEPTIEIFNTLCNNSVTYSVAPTCGGVALPTWVHFPSSVNPSPFLPKVIETQRGLPDRFDFAINFADPVFSEARPNASPDAALQRAPVYVGCFNVSMTLNGLNSVLERVVPLSLRVLRPCPPGMFAPKGDDSDGCTYCSQGYYQPDAGEAFCIQCPETFPRTVRRGSVNVNQCIPDVGGFLTANGTLEKCPRGAVCDEVGLTVESLPLNAGFWRASADSTDILDCPRPKYCVGGRLIDSVVVSRSLGQSAASTHGTLSSDGVCRQNHTGVFCYSCLPGYYKRSGDNLCMQCNDDLYNEDRNRIVGIFVATCIAFLFFLGVFFYLSCHQHRVVSGQTQQSVWEQRVQRVFNALDISIPLQIVIGFVQVVGSMSLTFAEVLPPFFVQIRDTFSIFALDVIQVVDFGCTLYYKNHFASLLVTTIVPIIVSLLIGAVHIAMGFTVAKFDALLRQELRTTSFSAFLVLLFLVYPSCSVRILATFACKTYDDGRSAMVSDPSVDCLSDVYHSYYIYAVLMTLLYPVGIPLLYASMLYRERKALSPYGRNHQMDKIAMAVREKDHNIKYLKFLWRPYKTHYFYFEVFELLRKLAQTSVVVFVASGSSGQVIFQMLVTVVSIVVLNSTLPYIEILNNVLALAAQWAIFGIAVVTLLTKLNKIGIASGLSEYNQTSLDTFLILLFFVVPVLAIIIILLQVTGRGAMRDIFFFLDWNRIDSKLERMASNSFRSFRKGKATIDASDHPDEHPHIHATPDNLITAMPKTLPEAITLTRRLQDNLNLVRRDLTEQHEQERAKANVLADERAELEHKTMQLEAELEKNRVKLVEQETMASKQMMLAQDAIDRANADAATRRMFLTGGSRSGRNEHRASDLQGRKSDLHSRRSDLQGRKSDLQSLRSDLHSQPAESPLQDNSSLPSVSVVPLQHRRHLSSALAMITAPFTRSRKTAEDGSASPPDRSVLPFMRNRQVGSQSPHAYGDRRHDEVALSAIAEQGESTRSIVFVREKEMRDGSIEKEEYRKGGTNDRQSVRSVVKERENLDGSFEVDVTVDER